MLKIFIFLLVSFFTFTAEITKAEAPPPEPPKVELSIEELVTKYAKEKGVSQDLAHYIAKYESRYNPKAVGDLNLTCRNSKSYANGQAVYARGVFQLTRCWYPEVSDAEAFDAETNIQIGISIIAKGREHCINQFSTCRDYYEKKEG